MYQTIITCLISIENVICKIALLQTNMKRLIFLLIVILIAAGCSIKSKPSSLFDGAALDGWHAYTKKGTFRNASDIFSVSNGQIRLNGDNPGYLMSKQSFSDFELRMEYKWNTESEQARGAGKKNSGVMYNVPTSASDMLWPAGIQFQIKEGATGDFVLLDSVTINARGVTSTPGKSVVVTKLLENEKPLGEWNQIVIKSFKGKCLQFLNGKLVNEGSEASTVSGRILLQYEGSAIDFRQISIRPLKTI